MNKWESTYGQQIFSWFKNGTSATFDILKINFLQNKVCTNLEISEVTFIFMMIKTVSKVATVSHSVPNMVKFFNHSFNQSVTSLFCHLDFKVVLGKKKTEYMELVNPRTTSSIREQGSQCLSYKEQGQNCNGLLWKCPVSGCYPASDNEPYRFGPEVRENLLNMLFSSKDVYIPLAALSLPDPPHLQLSLLVWVCISKSDESCWNPTLPDHSVSQSIEMSFPCGVSVSQCVPSFPNSLFPQTGHYDPISWIAVVYTAFLML